MKRRFPFILTACLAAAPLAVSAQRYDPPPQGGTISIEPKTGDGEYDATLPAFVDATSAALTARGFTILNDPGHAALALELILSRTTVGTTLAKVPGQSRPIVSGGLIVPLSTGRSDVVPLQRIRLEMRIRRRGGPGIVWSGAAVTVRQADQRRGTVQKSASDLSGALVQSYPVQPRGDIGVP